MHYTSPEKLRWASEVVSSHRALMSRRRAFWVPYASYCYRILRDRYYTLRSDAHSYLYSEGAPQWVKNAIERYHALVLYPYSDSAPAWLKTATESYYALRREYGYYALRYKYELAQARRQMRRSSHLTSSLSKRT